MMKYFTEILEKKTNNTSQKVKTKLGPKEKDIN